MNKILKDQIKKMIKTVTLGALFIATLLGTSPASAAKLKDVLNPDMLGVDIKYFESKAGFARNTYGDTKVFRVNKCEITVGVKGKTVQWFEVNNTPQCAFDPYQFVYNYKGKKSPTNKMTFGTFETITQGYGRFYATCMQGCGNAADPLFYNHWMGSRADNFIELRIGVVLAGSEALAANSDLGDAIKKDHNDEWLEKNTFSCTEEGYKYFSAARNAFKNVKVSTIAVGHEIPPDVSCY